MNEKWKDLRLWFCAVILIMVFLPWVGISIDTEALGYENSTKMAYSGLQMVGGTYIGSLVYLIALALLVMELAPQINYSSL